MLVSLSSKSFPQHFSSEHKDFHALCLDKMSKSLVLVILGLLYLIYVCPSYLVKAKRRQEKAREYGCKPVPFYPHTDPVFGLDLLRRMRKESKEDALLPGFAKRFEEVAGGVNTYSAISMGRRVIFTMEPENLKAVLSVNFKDYQLSPLRTKVISKNFGHSIFTTNGAAWEQSRAMLRPSFSKSMTGDLPVLEKHVANLVSKIPRDGQTVDLQELFPQLTMDSASELLFGESTHSLLWNFDERSKQFADAFDYAMQDVANKMTFLNFSPFPDTELKQAVVEINTFIDQYVAKALEYSKEHKFDSDTDKEEEGGRYVFLHELARGQYSAEKIRVELLSILIAGRDTTAALLSLLWYNLARRPDVVQNLRAEIAFLGSKPPSLAELKDLKFLRWTINESMSSLFDELKFELITSSAASLSYCTD